MRGSPAGALGRRIKKSKGPGEGFCVARQARRQAGCADHGRGPGRESGAKIQAGDQSQDPAHDLPGLWVGAR